MPADLFNDDLDPLPDDELFAAIEEFARAQPVEGWRHDYTEQWDESSLKNVAAFANTFGGLLIVGVRKRKGDLACELPGVESQSEYKTRIASAIAANISPVPFYNVFECLKPGTTNRRFCVIRVRDDKAMHLITKKGLDPVYVRNEDEARPANAEQVRRLVDREHEAPIILQRVAERAAHLRDSMVIGSDYQDKESDRWHLSPRHHSQTFLKLEMVPLEAATLELDKSHEDRLWKLVSEVYPRIPDVVGRDVAKQADSRHADYYERITYHKNLDYESRWRVTGTGDIGFATQMRWRLPDRSEFWSVVDLAIYIILFLRLTMKWWTFIRYFGEGRFYLQLNVDGKPVLRHPEIGCYIQGFNPTYSPTASPRPMEIRKDVIQFANSPGNAAGAEARVTYFTGAENLSTITTSVFNQLLRSLGHVVDRELLERSIESIARE